MKRRMTGKIWWVGILAAVALIHSAGAQVPTGELTGRVTDTGGGILPGVQVTATSPSLQGSRTAATSSNGDYKLAFLPPGNYRVTYSLDSFATALADVKISAAQTTISNVSMELASVAEEIVVTGSIETISTTSTGASTYTQDEMEKLAVNRSINDTILLAPGIFNSGPGANDEAPKIAIAGAMSFENLFLINGVVVNENLRGQALDLFIEDAIQETTASVTGVSAEYGRFTGGVVNTLTKSGGNNFSGSFRINYTNDDWRARTPLTTADRQDDLSETYEATFGGYLVKDHLWFFSAGRDRERSRNQQTTLTNLTYSEGNEQTRLEGKLTFSPTSSHSVIGSYSKIDQTVTNDGFGSFISLESLTNREDPQEIKSLNYTGILGESFFVEAQYSERDYGIANGAGGSRDLIAGTLMRNTGTSYRYHAPTFCGECEDEVRNNENLLLKGSYFLSTDKAGTHDLVFGYDTFSDIRFSINHQTGSDFTVWSSDILIDSNNEIFPQFFADGTTEIGFWAIFNLDIARPTDFTTNSFYVNDTWQLNDRMSVNLGLRYDENDGQNSSGLTTTSDEKISPRLGFSWDLKGDGDVVLNASAGTYVAAIANSIADSTTSGGAVGLFDLLYAGPEVNTDANCINNGTCATTEEALAILYDWYFANGGIDDPNDPLGIPPELILSVSIPGQTFVIPDTLKSPSMTELTVGVNKRLGSKGLFRADLVYRDWDDFYATKTTSDNPIIDTTAGPVDQGYVGNFAGDVLKREYQGLHTQFRYRLTDRLTLAGNYTLSRTSGNIEGETDASGPVFTSVNGDSRNTVGPASYPEFHDVRWSLPDGDLSTDSRHKVRAWAIYDIIDSERQSLSVSLLQHFTSGRPYGAVGRVNTRPFVNDPGYASPPPRVQYFFTDRDAFHTDDIWRTDIALNYSFKWNVFGRSLEVFVEPEIINVFNEAGAINVSTAIFDATSTGATSCNGAPCQTFNPFTETPVQGVHWAPRTTFGEPQDEEDDLQAPREFRFSVGFRF